MAFSTFRGMMAASKTGSGPVGLTDVYSNEFLTPLYYASQNSLAANGYGVSMGSSAQYAYAMVVPYSGGQAYFDTVNGGTSNLSYCTVNNINGGAGAVSLGASNGYSQIVADQAQGSTSSFLVQFRNNTGTANGVYLTTSGGTVSVNTTTSSLISLASLGGGFCMKSFPSQGYAWALGLVNAGTSGQIKVWNYGSGTVQATLALTSSNVNVNSSYIRMCALTNTLAFAIYTANTSGTLQAVGIDFNGSSTITWNTPVSTSTNVNLNSGAMCWTINSTTVGISYFKSGNTTQMFFRTITVASGGSITLNTEYSTTVAVAPIGYYTPFDPVNYTGSNWATAYVGIDCNVYVVEFALTGNVFTFGTVQYPINSSWSATVGNNNQTGSLIAMDSTHIGAVYQNQSAQGRYSVGNVIDVNRASASWNSAQYNTNYNYYNDNYSGYNNYNSVVWIGGTRYMWFGQNSGANSPQVWTKDFISNMSSQYSSQVSAAGTPAGNAIYAPLFCNLGYDYTDGNSRLLMLNTNNSGSGYATVINTGTQGSNPIFGTTTTFTSTGMTTNSYNLTYLSANNAICLYVNGSSQLFGTVIQTSGNAIGSVNTASQVLTVAGLTINSGANGFQVYPMSSTQVLVTYRGTISSVVSVYMVVLSISGSTITAGTPVQVASATTAITLGAAVFSGLTSGIVYYTNTGGTTLYANGFTISGTSITVGTQNTIATSGGTAWSAGTYNTNYTPIVAVSPNQAVCFVIGGANTYVLTIYTLKYNSINSITLVATTGANPGTGQQTGFLLTDNNNDYVGFFNTQSGTPTVNMIFRG